MKPVPMPRQRPQHKHGRRVRHGAIIPLHESAIFQRNASLCSRITQRNQSGNEVNESKESPVELFVTGGDSAELFELVEKAFHAIALLVNIQVVADYWKTRAEEADAKNCSRLGDTLRKPSESYRLDGEREAKSSPVPRYFQWVERMRTNWTNANNGQAVRLKASGVRQGKVSENFPKESYKHLFLNKERSTGFNMLWGNYLQPHNI